MLLHYYVIRVLCCYVIVLLQYYVIRALCCCVIMLLQCYVISKLTKKCTFYTLRFGCSFAVANTIKP